jgi:hypothetical protein
VKDFADQEATVSNLRPISYDRNVARRLSAALVDFFIQCEPPEVDMDRLLSNAPDPYRRRRKKIEERRDAALREVGVVIDWPGEKK